MVQQKTAIVDLAGQVRVAELATKSPSESEVGGAESVVDSDLKSQADESMAGETNEPQFPPEYEADHTQGNNGGQSQNCSVCRARLGRNKLKPACRDWIRECAQEEQFALSQATPVD